MNNTETPEEKAKRISEMRRAIGMKGALARNRSIKATPKKIIEVRKSSYEKMMKWGGDKYGTVVNVFDALVGSVIVPGTPDNRPASALSIGQSRSGNQGNRNDTETADRREGRN